MSGRDGRDGRDGNDGRDGLDADPAVVVDEVLHRLSSVLNERLNRPSGPDASEVREIVAGAVAEAVAALPPAKDGQDGKSVDWTVVRDAIEHFVGIAVKKSIPKDGRNGERGERGFQGLVGKDGDRGVRGPIGPIPRHEWRGTELRFEEPDGSWGKWTDLRGPRGYAGGGGGSSDTGGTTVVSGNSYFPGGWA